ncbi:MAG: ribosome maturation factor RimP [Acidimicrobiales bacterium]
MDERNTTRIDRITELIQPIADDYAIEIVDVELNNAVLKVVIDEPEGLTSESLVEVTKAISRMIDAEDPIPGRFTLEVTSPGVERPLKKPAHFRRAVGDHVSIKTNPDVDGERRIDGQLAAADENGVTVTTESGDRILRYGEIRTARTVFEWGPAPKPGGQKNTKKESASR